MGSFVIIVSECLPITLRLSISGIRYATTGGPFWKRQRASGKSDLSNYEIAKQAEQELEKRLAEAVSRLHHIERAQNASVSCDWNFVDRAWIHRVNDVFIR